MPRKPKAPKTAERAPAVQTPIVPRVVGRGGRITRDTTGIGLFGAMTIIPPPNPAGDWRALDLDAKTLGRTSVTKLADYLADLSPEVGKALFDFLRECNPGYELTAYRPGTTDVDEQAQAALDAFIFRLDDRQDGIFDVTIGRLFLAMFLRGALLAELVLDEQGRMPLDIATPDPWVVRWRRAPDPVLGTRLVLCQWQDGRLVDLDAPTIRYVPVDPMPGSPYGRPLAAPALFVCLFMLAMMHDLRRVIQQQGYPRHDIEISLKELIESAPQMAGTTQELLTLADQIRQQVEDHIATLQPDDTLVHTSMVKVNTPVGAVDTASMGGIASVIDWLEREATKALKSVPFLMSMSQSQTETMANRQWEAHLQGIRTMQHYAETPLSRLFTLALQAQGIAAEVQLRFAENRASEEQRYEMVRQLKVANAREGYAMGALSQDDAAQYAWGREAADVPEPRDTGAPAAPDAATQANPDQSASRSAPAPAQRDRRAKLVPLGADQPFDPLEPLDPLSDDDRAALGEFFDRSQPANGKYRGLLDAEVVE